MNPQSSVLRWWFVYANAVSLGSEEVKEMELTWVSLRGKSSAACYRGWPSCCKHHGSQRNQTLLCNIAPVPDRKERKHIWKEDKNQNHFCINSANTFLTNDLITTVLTHGTGCVWGMQVARTKSQDCRQLGARLGNSRPRGLGCLHNFKISLLPTDYLVQVSPAN